MSAGAAERPAADGTTLLRGVVREQARPITASALLLGAHQGFEAMVPVVVGATLDAAIEPSDGDALLLWLGVLAVLFVFLANAYRWGARIGTAAMERAAHGLRMRLVDRVLDPRGGGEGGRLPGELLSVATADVDATALILRALAFGFAVAAAIVTGAVVLLTISVPLGLVILIGLPLTLTLAGRIAAPLERRAAGEQAGAANAAGVAADLVDGHRVLQGLRATEPAAVRYRVASRRALRATIGAARAEAVVWGSANLVAGVALAAVALVGGRLAVDGQISIGQLIAAVGVTQFLVGPLSRLAMVGGIWARARASANRLAPALAVPPAVPAPADVGAADGGGGTPGTSGADAAAAPGGAAADDGRGRTDVAGDADSARAAPAGDPLGVVVRGLEHGALRGVDLRVEPGTVHGVVCGPAAAKALLDVLGQEVRPGAGTVALTGGLGAPASGVDGGAAGAAAADPGGGAVDTATLHPADVRRRVVVAPHDAALFADTVRANVVAAGAGAGDVDAAIAAAAADELATVLPQGLETRLSDGGSSLSGGQRQRIALARALATAAPVLVLHDPTTALDSATEARVAAALRDARGATTTILVATSPGLLAVCDAVTVIRDGVTAAVGGHGDLVAADAAYRETVLA